MRRSRHLLAGIISFAAVAGCTEPVPGAAPSSTAPASTAAAPAPTTEAVSTTDPVGTGPAPETSTAPTATTAPSAVTLPATRPAPSGEPFVIGVVNTEGAPGLDFPEFTNAFRAAADYVNTELGGFGGRPLELQICVSNGSPESSQGCAQQHASQGVDLVMLGLDIFVAYPTYQAADLPVYGAVPIFPGDYTAEAVYLTAGNLVLMASTANAMTNPDYIGAKRVAVIANDAAATVSALGALEPALQQSGAEYTIVKGAENETDAGYLSLMQQAADTDPEVILSLYGESGCVALMRARVSLGLDVPVFSNTGCLSDPVLAAAGDAADGWYFGGANGAPESADIDVMRRYVAEVTGESPETVNASGFTSVGWIELLSAWSAADRLGSDVSGLAILDEFRGRRAMMWGAGSDPLACGSVPAYSAVCSFAIPFAVRDAGATTPAFDGASVSALELLPV